MCINDSVNLRNRSKMSLKERDVGSQIFLIFRQLHPFLPLGRKEKIFYQNLTSSPVAPH